MAKVASDIPTSKPIFNPHTKQNKTPESAPATKPSENAQENQVIPFTTQTQQTQELANMANSITNLVTTFEKVLERQNAIEARQ